MLPRSAATEREAHEVKVLNVSDKHLQAVAEQHRDQLCNSEAPFK